MSIFNELNNFNIKLKEIESLISECIHPDDFTSLLKRKNKLNHLIYNFKLFHVIEHLNKPLTKDVLDSNTDLFYLEWVKNSQKATANRIKLNIKPIKLKFSIALKKYKKYLFNHQDIYTNVNSPEFNRFADSQFKSLFNFDYSNKLYKDHIVTIYEKSESLFLSTSEIFFSFHDLPNSLCAFFDGNPITIEESLKLSNPDYLNILFDKVMIEKEISNF